MVAIFWSLFSTGINWVISLFTSHSFKLFAWTILVGLFLKFLGFLGIAFLTSLVLTPIFDLFLIYIEGGFLGIIISPFNASLFEVVEYLGFIAGIKMLLSAYVFRFTYKTMISFAPFQGSLFK